LLNDPESEKAVEEYVTQPKEFWASGTKETLARIKAVPRWRLLLLERLRASDVGDREIAAFAQDPDAEPHLRALLDRAEAHVACSAVKALGKRVERSRLLQLIKHPNEELRCAAILALGQQTGTEQYLRPLLRGSRAERIAAAKSLAGDETSAAIVADHLLRYPADDVRLAAVDALAAQSFGSDVLRDYFIETRRLPEHELLPHCEPIFHGLVRSRIVEVLARHDCSTGLMVASLEDPHRRVRVAAARVLVDHPSMAGRLVERFEAGDGDVYDVICAKLTNRPSVREHLLWCLNRDLPELRFAAFRYLVDRAGSRETLKTMLGSAEVREEWRATIVGALMRDPDSMQLVRGCVSDQSEEVRYQAFRLLRHDKTVRERFREQAGDVEWMKATAQKETNPLARPYVSGVLSGDPDAYPILVDYLDSDDSGVLTYVAPMLRGYRQAYPRLADLLVHPSPSVRAAAMRALGDHEPVRDVLVDALAPDPPTCDALDVRTRALRSRDLGELRRAAADALKDVPFLRPRFRSLLNNDDKHVREAAIHAVSADESAEAVKLLRERLTAEPEEDLRAQIVWALRADPGSVGALRDRLHNDYRSDVRQQAARALGTGDLTPAFALREQPFVAGVVRTLQGLLVPGPGAAALGTFLSAPRPVDLDAEPELGEIVVAWLCARLCWAYELGREFEGQVLGELELQVPRMGQPGSLVLIRVAMDPFVLARERRLRPNHNLMVVWEIAKHLTAVDPPSVVLGCADVSFLNLQPPPLEPGEVRFGPTFFGFRVNARRTIT
jgi:HEAT repeat protein